MRRYVPIIILVAILGQGFLYHAAADAIYVCGDVSGTWSADTVLVTCEVRVPPGDTLIIEPGTKVLFWTYSKFIVDDDALLHAVGTESDSILFDEYWEGNYWHGIRFLGSSDACSLSYCHIRHGSATGTGEDTYGGGVYVSGASISITHSLIEMCSANAGSAVHCDYCNPQITENTIRNNSGPAIYCSYSSPAITQNNITNNSSPAIWCYLSSPEIMQNNLSNNLNYAIYCNQSNPEIIQNTISNNNQTGIHCRESSPEIMQNTISSNLSNGIYCDYSSPTITENTITGNSSSYGAGIRCNDSSPIIAQNTITSNSASNYGGAMYCTGNNSFPVITGNTISNNSATYGGAIYLNGGGPRLEDNEVSCNFASQLGGGLYANGSTCSLTNETIAFNDALLGGGVYCTGSTAVIKNTVLWGNDSLQIYQVSASNVQVTYSCSQQFWPGTGNIFSNPMFIGPGCPGDYQLQTSSLCIDAGDPDPIYNDPDGSRADMGCYSCDISGISPYIDQPALTEIVLYGAEPNPFRGSTGLTFALPNGGHANLAVFDITGCHIATLVDGWVDAGVHRVVFDGSGVAPGIYFCKLTVGQGTTTRKLVSVR